MKKKWNSDLWKPLCIRPVEIEYYLEPGKSTGGFLPYQAPNDRYKVRGIMPSSNSINEALIIEYERDKKKVKKIKEQIKSLVFFFVNSLFIMW